MNVVVQPLRAYEHWLANYRRVWRGTIGTSLLNPILFLAAFGIGLGTLVDQSGNAPAGVLYLDYVAPGLLATAAMQTASIEATWPVMAAIKWTRTYHAMLASPLVTRDVLVGHQLFVVTRVLVTSTLYLAVIAAFGAVSSFYALLVPLAAVLVGTAFSAPVAAFAAAVKNDTMFPTLFRFVIVPMFLFSGAFFPVERLPLVLEAAAYVTPIWHGVELCRALTLGHVDGLALAGHAAYLLAWTVIGLALAQRAYARRLLG